jgi:hypothetical protein
LLDAAVTALAWLAALAALAAPAAFYWCCCGGSTGCANDGCCPGVTLPNTLTGTDTFWSTNFGVPSFTFTRRSGTCLYEGCMIVPYGNGDPPCPNVNADVAYHYTFDATNCAVALSYPGHFVLHPSTSTLFCCPSASTCATTPVTCGVGAFVLNNALTTCAPVHIVFDLNASSEPQLVPWRSFGLNPFTRIILTP